MHGPVTINLLCTAKDANRKVDIKGLLSHYEADEPLPIHNDEFINLKMYNFLAKKLFTVEEINEFDEIIMTNSNFRDAFLKIYKPGKTSLVDKIVQAANK